MKKLISMLLCLLLLTALPCSAQEPELFLGPVVDQADLLTPEEDVLLIGQAKRIYDEFGIFTAIITVNDLDGKSSTAYADDYYDRHYYQKYPNGVLLLIATDTREWAISTCGSGIDLLTDWELDELFYSMSDSLSEDDYYRAFVTFTERLPEYLKGTVVSEPGIGDYVRIFFLSLAIGAAAGGIGILIMRGQMNTAKPQKNAGNYLVSGSYQLKKHMDIFLYSRVTRTRKPENNGSSSHRSSGGVRHGGRSGRF